MFGVGQVILCYIGKWGNSITCIQQCFGWMIKQVCLVVNLPFNAQTCWKSIFYLKVTAYECYSLSYIIYYVYCPTKYSCPEPYESSSTLNLASLYCDDWKLITGVCTIAYTRKNGFFVLGFIVWETIRGTILSPEDLRL